jgi:hypothetical protein
MKKIYFIWTLILLSFTAACKELGNEKKIFEKGGFGRINVDSVIEEDTLKISDSVLLRYSSQLLWFPNLDNKNLFKEIYQGKEISDFSKNGIQAYLSKEKQEIYNRLKTSHGISELKQNQQWSYISQMNIRMNRNNFISIQYYNSQFGPENKVRYHYEEKVFDFKKKKRLVLSDILVLSEATMSKILKLSLEKTTMMQQIKTYDGKAYSILSTITFPVTRNFYFDDSNLYFHYNMNEISKDYDIGDIILTISWEDLIGYIKPDFARRMKIN